MLQARGFDDRLNEALLRRQIGDALFDWLKPAGGGWDAALDGSVIAPAPLPSPSILRVRDAPATTQNANLAPQRAVPEIFIGSNNWAVGGALSTHGGAILADDMHLGLGVPNIWFRAQLNIGEGAAKQRIVGATLPGGPSMVVGSNGKIAWGFTNGYGQWFDWVAIEPGSALAASIKTSRETIAVKGAPSIALEVRETAFGPVLRTIGKTDYVLSWALYREGALNAHATRLMFAKTLDEAILIAHQSGIPHQNALIVDHAGNLAWTIMGRIPAYPAGVHTARGTFTLPEELPTGWLATDKYPLVKNPADARLWTANNRQLGGEGGQIIGDGGFDLGARAKQIRDRLNEQSRFDEKGLYAIQLDNESRFLKRWSALAFATAAAKPNDKTSAIAKELKAWNGRADVDQTGHRIARGFRQQVLDQLWKSWLAAAQRDHGGQPATGKPDGPDGRFEYPVWQALEARAAHLLPPPYATWDDFLAAQMSNVYDDFTKQQTPLADATWGKRNTANFRHPFSRAMPFLSAVLDMPKTPMAGDNHMPMVAAPSFGASQRMVVSPGHEEQGIFVMPGGQSGHPLSPFYGAGHSDWLAGKPGNFLAGETLHTLRLAP
jgi:penicillin amidase